MKIWGDSSRVSGAYEKYKNLPKVEKTKGTEDKKDIIIISESAKEYHLASRAVKDAPDIREDKVRELKTKYDSGTYKVNIAEVADKMMNSFLE